MTSDDDTWRGAARLSPAALLTKRQGETVKWLLSKLRMGWASLLRSRRPDARTHDCPLPLRPVHARCPLTPSQHRVQFRLPQRPCSSRPCDVLPSGVAVPGLPGTDRLRESRQRAWPAASSGRVSSVTGVTAGTVTLGPPGVCWGAWGHPPEPVPTVGLSHALPSTPAAPALASQAVTTGDPVSAPEKGPSAR